MLAWAKKLVGARAAEARAAGTQIRDGGADSVSDGRVARHWHTVVSEGGMRVLLLENQSRFVLRCVLGDRW
jgi:hypothetical protein